MFSSASPAKIVFLDRATLSPQTVLKPLPLPHALHTFERTAANEVAERIGDADIVVTNKVRLDAAALADAPNLKMIAIAATGTDIVDLDACAARGIVVSNIRGYAVRTVPEHTFALIFALLTVALLLLAMTVVLLPILPDRNIDPWDTVNPHRVWLITVAIAALSFVGYVAVRIAGARRGLLVAGSAGALVSSTAVTLTYSRLSKTEPQIASEAGVAIMASWIVSLARMTTLAVLLAPVLLKPLLPAPQARASKISITFPAPHS